MSATRLLACLFTINLFIFTGYTASIAEREPVVLVSRQDRNSFYKDFGDAKVWGYFNKDQSGGFNVSRDLGNGSGLSGNLDWDPKGRFNGGLEGSYSWNNGKTRLGGNLNVDKGGKPSGQFSFSHNF